jgi:hypothetical protein
MTGVKNLKSTVVRLGNRQSPRPAQALLSAPDVATVGGCALVLLGCGLRRSEVAAQTYLL